MFEGELVEILMNSYVKDRLIEAHPGMSVAPIYLSLFKAYLTGIQSTEDVLRKLSLQVKVDKILLGHRSLEEKFYIELFTAYDHFIENTKTKKKDNTVKDFIE